MLWIFLLIQIFLWIVVGGAMAFIVISPILISLGVLEFIGALTINNILNLIQKIPFIGPIISGLIGSGIGITMICIGIWVWINYGFIVLRCIGGPNV